MEAIQMLTKCSECGHVVSTTAKSCPNCGSICFMTDETKRRFISIDMTFSYPDDMLNHILDFNYNYGMPLRYEIPHNKDRYRRQSSMNTTRTGEGTTFCGGRIGMEINRKNVQLSNPLYIHGTHCSLPIDTPFPYVCLNYSENFNPMQCGHSIYPSQKCPLNCEGWNPISQLSSTLSYTPSCDDAKDTILTFVVETTTTCIGEDFEYIPLIYGDIRQEKILESTKKLSISIKAKTTGEYRIVKYYIPNGKLFRKRDILAGERKVPIYAYHIASISQS